MDKKYTAKELDLLHAELYDILGETIRICRKHDIPYFVIGGTAIGALYDRAILPWDDDIDIGMARKDYNRFLEVAPRELGDSYFLSWIETDPHSPYYYAKVKKNNTLFVEEMFKNVPMHPGIFVDIFPFDRIPDNKLLRKLQYDAAGFLKCCLMGKEIWMWKHFGKCEIEHPTDRGAFSCFLNKAVDVLFSKKAIYRMLVAVQSCFNSWNTKYFNNVMTTTDHVTGESLRHLQPVPFGPLTVNAPDNLEGFLRYNYPTLHRYTEEEQEKVNNPDKITMSGEGNCLHAMLQTDTVLQPPATIIASVRAGKESTPVTAVSLSGRSTKRTRPARDKSLPRNRVADRLGVRSRTVLSGKELRLRPLGIYIAEMGFLKSRQMHCTGR